MRSSLLLVSCLVLLASSAAVDCSRRVNCLTNYAPVCGSDGQSYSNQCVFDNAVCLAAKAPNARPLTKLFDGACDTMPNPFCGLRCSNTASQPVCGSDGKTYANSCLLSAARCGNVTLTTAYEGTCTPTPTTCKPTPKPKPTPKACADACPMIYMPVCGSDGKTYSNACELGIAACRSKSIKLTMAHTGECEARASSCVRGCPKIALPVCGSDGKTYGNQCLLNNAACLTKALTKVSNGSCAAACAAVTCAQYSECKVDAASGRAFCADVCAPQRCAADEVCSLRQVQCLAAPCPPVATCTKRA